MREKTLKGIVHAGLTLAAVLELLDCESRKRKFILGLAAGWHLHSTVYHLIYEKEE